MSDARSGPNQDPSMDDILASIRKIISDDEARAQVGGLRTPNAGPGERPPVVPPMLPSASAPAPRDDVLLLTEIVEEPKSMPNEQPAAMPRIDPLNAAETPQPPTEPAAGEKPLPVATSGEALVGAGVAGAASSAFARLNQAVQDSVPAPAATDPGPRVGGSGQTIEDLVKEMLRPMLKEWLDTNLPPMVERYVEREIARLTRR
jgi:cell pole-organizing protein PopZ